MAQLCESILSKDINFNCDEQVVKGLESDGVIINRSDVDFSATVFDTNSPNIIKSLTLKSGKRGYEVQQLGNTPFTGAKTDLVVGTYRNTWTHEIPIAILANTPEVSEKIIDGLANGTYVLILRNKSKGTDGSAEYQVYGYEQGLVVSAGTSEKYSDDTEGGWLITLQETAAPKSALFLFNTDSTTTAQLYEDLKTPTVGNLTPIEAPKDY